MKRQDRQDLLIQKLEKEFKQFRWELLKLPKDQIIDKADEISTKADIKGYIESEVLPQNYIEQLLSKENALETLYADWRTIDTPQHTEDIKNVLYYTCEYEPNERRLTEAQKNNENESPENNFNADYNSGETEDEDEDDFER